MLSGNSRHFDNGRPSQSRIIFQVCVEGGVRELLTHPERVEYLLGARDSKTFGQLH
jgi:hypothetical protein